MELLALNGDIGALFWTSLANVVLLLVPGVLYAYYVLDGWMDDERSRD